MANPIAEVKAETELVEPPDTSHLITEDDTPVDNIFSAKQQRLLVEPLYSSWAGPGENRPFLADANVGVFYAIREPAIVPDVFVALDVQAAEEWWTAAGRSYLIWEHGKAPDVVIEIVSNKQGDELTRKLNLYAWIGVPLYAVFDPERQIQEEMLVIYRINATGYLRAESTWLERLQLGLTLWEGEFEGRRTQWLRWCDQDGHLIPTGQERAERLAAQLRALGIEPEA
jgi:Uma2 family endonuclease